MQTISLIAGLTVAVLPGLVSAANNVKMINHCPYDLYSWTVGPAGSGYIGHDHEALKIPANSVTIQGMVDTEAIGGGIALKIRDLPKYEVAPAGIIQVEYNFVPSKNDIWYDLSAIDCDHTVGPEHPKFCPLIGGGMKTYVAGADERKCPSAWCGAEGCFNTYTKPGHWKGEPSFVCDAGADIIVEMCLERAGPRTFNGHTEPGHPVNPNPESKPGMPTQNGVCGARSPGGATCFGYAHGNCCSSYGWCGFSEAHCGNGCQAGFGDCFGSGPAYQPPVQPSYSQPSYSRPTSIYSRPPHSHVQPPPSYVQPPPSYVQPKPSYAHPTPSYAHPTPSYVHPTPSYVHPKPSYGQPTYTHVEHTWPVTSHSKPTFSYVKPSTIKPSYVKPTPSHYSRPSHHSQPTPAHGQPTPVYSKPSPSHAAPSHSKPAPDHSYVKPTPIYTAPAPTKPSHYTPAPGPTHTAPAHYTPPAHAPPAHTPSFAPPYTPPPYRTIYATHTVTETRAAATKTVTLNGWHQESPPPPPTHTPQQEPQVASTWYGAPTPPAPVYYPAVEETYAGPGVPEFSAAVYYPSM